MRHDKELLFFKLVAVSGILLYLYKVSKKQGSLQGINVNPERIAGLAAQFVPREYRGHAEKIGTAVISKMMN